MAQLSKNALGNVKCATPAKLETVDGAAHEMFRIFPVLVLPDGAKDAKAFAKAVDAYLTLAAAVKAGEKVQIIGEDGKQIAEITPTDNVPSKADRTESTPDKDGKVSVTISHGTNMPKDLPASYADLIDCLNDGIKALISQNGRSTVTSDFRAGDGQRGRKATEFDPSTLA